MQKQKEHTRKLLQKISREAFLQKGFKSVSMREISQKSGIGLSNIYNYYSCKDDLLAVVLSPLLEALDNMLDNHNRNETLSIEVFTSEDYHRKYIQEMMTIIEHYRKELKLLFLHTQESRFKNYSEQWIKRSSAIGVAYMEEMKTRYPDLHTSISPFFIHFISSWWMNMMKEVALHEELSHDELALFIHDFIHYSIGGWKKLMQADKIRDKNSYECKQHHLQ